MVPRGVLVALLLAVVDIAVCAPAETGNVDPVDLDYYCFHLKQNEENHKTPILLIHALCFSHADWKGLYEILAFETGRRVCAVDIRNHGGSPWNDRFDVEAMAADIGHFLDEENIQSVNLIGHSIGGKISMHYALKNPDRVNSLVVEDMRPNNLTPQGLTFVQEFIQVLQEAIKSVPDGLNEVTAKEYVVKSCTEKLAGFGFNDSISGILENVLEIDFVNGKWQYKMNLEVIEKSIHNPEEFLTESSGLYSGPTLFIYGTESPIDVPGEESNIRQLFPNAKLTPVQGAGHLIHEYYTQFQDEVIKFLDDKN